MSSGYHHEHYDTSPGERPDQKWPGQARPDQAIGFVVRPAEAEEVNNVMLARSTKCGRERLLTLSLTRLRIFYKELPGMRNVLLLIMTMKSNLSIWSIRKKYDDFMS